MKIKNVVIVGGTTVIGTGVETVLKNRGISVRRIQGADHYTVARGLAAEGVAAGLSRTRTAVTSDRIFGNALAGGVAQGLTGSVLLLNPATSLNAGVGSELYTRRAAVRPIRVYGGYDAISWPVRRMMASRLRTP